MRVLESTAEFLARLRTLGISVRLEASRLRINAPKNVLTPELRDQLADRKDEIITFLNRSLGALHQELPAIERVTRDGPLPLSFAQARLWFLDQLTPGSAAYIFPMHTRLRGKLDVALLEKCLSEISRRHEILRTNFPATDGTPSQVILPPSVCRIPVRDISNVARDDREKIATEVAAAEAKTPFDLAHGPLWRVSLLRLDEQDHVLLMCMHHIIFDGTSVNVFWQELATLYTAFGAGEASPLAEPPLQYVDFASWQKKALDGPVRESHLKYWKQQLGENPPDLRLPMDGARESSDERHSGAKLAMELTPEVSAALKNLSNQEQASLSMTLLAAWQLLLHRWSGQEEILVGMPVAGRSRSEFEKMVGIFVNTMVLRTQFGDPLSFLDLLHSVRDNMLDALEHQDMPFEELVGALDPRRDIHRTPLFQAFFNNLNMRVSPIKIPGLSVEPFGEFEVESKFDVSLYVYEHDNSISLMLVYNPQLFANARMRELLDQYAGLLAQIGCDPRQSTGDYSLAGSTPAQTELPDPSKPLNGDWCGLIHSRFLREAKRTPENIALLDERAEWSYRELDGLSSRLSGELVRLGVGRGDTVAIYGHRSAPLVVALLAILRSGAAFCILDPAYPDLRLAKCLRVAKPKAWIQVEATGAPGEGLEAALAEIVGNRRILLPDSPRKFPKDWRPNANTVDDLEGDQAAYLAFTSGTTGEPKCILGTHSPVSHFLDWHIRSFGLNRDDRFSMLSGLAHDPLLRDIFTPLSLGATLVIPSPETMLSPGKLPEWIKRQQVTVAHLTPAMQSLMSMPSGNEGNVNSIPTLRYAFLGGDIVTSRDIELLNEIAPNAECISFYGATETPQVMAWCRPGRSGVTQNRFPDTAVKQIAIGRSIPDVQLLILNRAGKLAGVGEVGEIHIRTPYLSKGYANDDALTRERFPVNPFASDPCDRLYKTGDLGRYRPDGMVEFVGRSDSQVKIRGFRIELREIESSLETHPAIKDCAVVVEGNALDNRKLIAYYVPSGEAQLSSDELRSYLAKRLSDYQIPSEFHRLKAVPLNPNGKVDRHALATGRFRSSAPKTVVSPRDFTETKIAEVWCQVLGLESVGIYDNFFELGGHSLSATRLIAQLTAAFEIEIPLQALFLEPTIAGLAKHLEYDPATKRHRYVNTMPSWKCVVAAQPKGNRTPFFFVAGYQGPDDALLVLSRFVPHLGSDQPVFGFRPRWIQGDGVQCASIEETAREFVSELRSIQARGPYLLGGHCVGGVVALEMARLLMMQGETVSLLALLDTERPSSYRAVLAEVRLSWQRLKHIKEVVGQILRSNGSERRAKIQEVIDRKMARSQREQKPTADNRFYHNKVSYRRAAYRHRVRDYPGQITLFVNDLQYRFDRYMGWRGVPKGGLVVHRIPGDHDTVLQTYGKNFAEVLLNCLNEARPDSVELQVRTAEVCS